MATVWAAFEALREKATSKLDALLDVPTHATHDLSRAFARAMKAFAALWSFQASERRALVDAGLQRCDIGEIASKIGHLHFSWYLRCADLRSLMESYLFYEAIHARQYYAESLLDSTGSLVGPPAGRGAGACTQPTAGPGNGAGLPPTGRRQPPRAPSAATATMEQQLRYYARFILVCILLGKKEEAMNLMQELQALVMSYTLAQDGNPPQQEWQAVLAEVGALLMADPGMPLPRSPGAALTFRPSCRVWPGGLEAAAAPHVPRIHHAVLTAYQYRQVKLGDLPVDVVRIMQALEWRDDALLAPVEGAGEGDVRPTSRSVAVSTPALAAAGLAGGGDGATDTPGSANGAAGGLAAAAARAGAHRQPQGRQRPGSQGGGSWPNPAKTLLYRTTAPALLAALHGVAAGLPQDSDSFLFLYLSCSSIAKRLAAETGATAAAGYPTTQPFPPCAPPPPHLPPVPSTSCLTATLAAAAAARGATAAPPPSAAPAQQAAPDVHQAWCLSPPSPSVGTAGTTPQQAVGTSGRKLGLPAHTHALFPMDLLPLTRHRLFVVADGDVAGELQQLSGRELAHPVAALLSPAHRPSAFGDAAAYGQLLTLMLTLPVSAFCLIMGEMHPSPATLRDLQDAVDESLGEVAHALQAALPRLSDGGAGTDASTVWAEAFQDALLRSLICRFVLARAAFAYHRASTGRPNCQASCMPELPAAVSPASQLCVGAVMRIAAVLRRQTLFEGAGAVAGGSPLQQQQQTQEAPNHREIPERGQPVGSDTGFDPSVGCQRLAGGLAAAAAAVPIPAPAGAPDGDMDAAVAGVVGLTIEQDADVGQR